ncbi:hypothetical protein C9J12_05080 [Photobacterium frigidiphilum]|uniref:Uracil-DNA glycosylase-like domain-containing protein n=1 Tax=Photobacterium frigidiphilum TaxID=264736 RepID=A0A2T3JM62_9GAMM|nr:hypothetical protein [Photobacterium frigidiphilum]PSU50119.1 hypothetical protein C9J12_05080 [Photobacterium frigidiphilum]
MDEKEQLIDICKQYVLPSDENVVIKEPYIPYIPHRWNRILVLAESQNLSSSNGDYVEILSEMSVEQRIQRLGSSSDYVGVYPWDDGSMKLAVEASLQVKALEVGVSNAVLWSQRGAKKENVNPDLNLQQLSSEVWSQLLPILNPQVVVCCGKIAQNVISKANWHGTVINFRLPAKNAMSRVSGMFNEADLLKRYPEVSLIVDENPSWLDGGYRQNKIFFACHAVSTQAKI